MTSVDDVIRSAKAGRCLLREKWDLAEGLSGRDQLKLVRVLIKIKPVTVERGGRRVPCEPRFELRPKDRRRLTAALIADRVPDGQILAVVPGLSRRTFNRIKADVRLTKSAPADGLPERQFRTKRIVPAGYPGPAYLDATSGANREAAIRFRELLEAA